MEIIAPSDGIGLLHGSWSIPMGRGDVDWVSHRRRQRISASPRVNVHVVRVEIVRDVAALSRPAPESVQLCLNVAALSNTTFQRRVNYVSNQLFNGTEG